MRGDTIQLGEVTVTRVLEWSGPIRTVSDIVPDSTPGGRAALTPEFRNPDDDAYRCAIQSWVLRSEGRTIVVDTGAGNDRNRSQIPQFDHLTTSFLENLRRAGVEPEDVDLVVNTHVHYDHVGWNTRLLDEEWVPTFPNARYLIPGSIGTASIPRTNTVARRCTPTPTGCAAGAATSSSRTASNRSSRRGSRRCVRTAMRSTET
jgi:hypothetical protein